MSDKHGLQTILVFLHRLTALDYRMKRINLKIFIYFPSESAILSESPSDNKKRPRFQVDA